MNRYRLLSDVASDADIEAGFEWYESEQPGLGLEFLDEIRAAYTRILDGPFKYKELFSAVIASWLPALRAAGLDPTTALRNE